jgi:hypothetical protein
MSKISLLIIFIVLIWNIKSSLLRKKLISMLLDEDQDKYNPEKFNSSNSLILFNLYDQFNKYFQVNSSDQNAKDCRDFIFNDLVLDYDYTNLFFYSGHKLTEVGYPEECINNNFTFLLSLFTFGINDNMTKEEDQISYFISKNKTNLGICIWNECNNFVKNNLMNNIDTKFELNMENIYNIKNMKIFLKDKNTNNDFSTGIKIFRIILYIYISLYIIFKLIIWIYIKYKEASQTEKRKRKDYLKMDENTIIKEEENEDEDSFNDIEDIKQEIKNRNNNNINKIEEEKKDKIEEEKEEEENEHYEEEDEEEEEEDEGRVSKDSLFKKNVEESKIRYIERNLKKLNNNYSINKTGYEDDNNNNKNLKKISLLNNNLEEKKNKLTNCVNLFNKFNSSFLSYVSIQTLTEYNNEIYSNKGLEMITGLRVIFIILITINIIFISFISSPSIKQINNSFLSSALFIIIKFSSFGIYFWIFLDGFVYIFKLMHFIKKDRSFLRFIKFGMNLVPKIFCFLIIFYVFYFLQKDFGKLIVNSSILFEQYIENEYNYKCLNNPLYLLFPFFNPITSDNYMTYNYYNNCFQFTYLIINEFYCIIITIILFFFLYKYKSKILEIIISIIILINILGINFLPYFFENIKEEKYYLLKYVLGETFSIRYPHSMFNIFFIGLFTGLIYYYHYYSLNDLNSFLSESDQYLPFSFLSKLMQYLLKCNKFIKIALIIFSIAIILLDSLLFFIIKNNGENNQILYEFSTSLKIFYLYETPLLILAVSLLLIFLLFAEDKFQIKSFLGSKIFYTVEKSSFAYICFIQMINLLFLSSTTYHGDTWSFISLLYITCFEFMVGLIVSLLSTLFFELPFKVLINNLRGKNKK